MNDHDDFFNALELSNVIAKRQTNDALILALMGRIAEAINKDEDPNKIIELVKLKNELEK